MKSITRPFAAAGAAVLLSLSLTACGGGGAPTDASAEEFCGTGDELSGLFDDIAEDDYEGFVDAAGQAADKFEEVGTPEDISDEAREGFETLIEALGSLDAGEVEDSVTELTENAESAGDIDQNALVNELFGIEEGDQDKVQAFTEYSSEACSG